MESHGQRVKWIRATKLALKLYKNKILHEKDGNILIEIEPKDVIKKLEGGVLICSPKNMIMAWELLLDNNYKDFQVVVDIFCKDSYIYVNDVHKPYELILLDVEEK